MSTVFGYDGAEIVKSLNTMHECDRQTDRQTRADRRAKLELHHSLTVKPCTIVYCGLLVSSILHHHPALLHHHTLIMDRLLTFLVAFSILVLKLSFSQSLSLHSRLSFLRLIPMRIRCLAVTGGGSLGKCGR